MVDMDTIVSLCKRRGFIFQSSEIYGGLASTYDYGPLGVEMKRNIRDSWWRTFINGRDDCVGIETAILMHPQVWVTSGHLANFTDPLVECRNCHHRFRFDHLLVGVIPISGGGRIVVASEGGTEDDIEALIQDKASKASITFLANEIRVGPARVDEAFENVREGSIGPLSAIPCPNCETVGTLGEPRQFNLMLKTFLGPVEDEAATVYLRPETAQGIFVNFQNVLNATRRKLPFGIGQIGKSFRNEITVGNYIFRTREFEQMELEYFVKPGDDDAQHEAWVQFCMDWFLEGMGIAPDKLRVRAHEKEELSHYSKATSDIEYLFPWGWGELMGIANRTDFDLKAHSQATGVRLEYFDDETQEHVVPYVIEPAVGVDRILITNLVNAYTEEEAPTADGKTEKRVLLKLHPSIAPVKVAVLPLSRNARLTPKAREVYDLVRREFVTQYDDAQSIGRRYRRQDEIGTPLCVTVDFQTVEEDNGVTIRDRDTMEQVRAPIGDLVAILHERLGL